MLNLALLIIVNQGIYDRTKRRNLLYVTGQDVVKGLHDSMIASDTNSYTPTFVHLAVMGVVDSLLGWTH